MQSVQSMHLLQGTEAGSTRSQTCDRQTEQDRKCSGQTLWWTRLSQGSEDAWQRQQKTWQYAKFIKRSFIVYRRSPTTVCWGIVYELFFFTRNVDFCILILFKRRNNPIRIIFYSDLFID